MTGKIPFSPVLISVLCISLKKNLISNHYFYGITPLPHPTPVPSNPALPYSIILKTFLVTFHIRMVIFHSEAEQDSFIFSQNLFFLVLYNVQLPHFLLCSCSLVAPFSWLTWHFFPLHVFIRIEISCLTSSFNITMIHYITHLYDLYLILSIWFVRSLIILWRDCQKNYPLWIK